jgi:hypothetical protein
VKDIDQKRNMILSCPMNLMKLILLKRMIMGAAIELRVTHCLVKSQGTLLEIVIKNPTVPNVYCANVWKRPLDLLYIYNGVPHGRCLVPQLKQDMTVCESICHSEIEEEAGTVWTRPSDLLYICNGVPHGRCVVPQLKQEVIVKV